MKVKELIRHLGTLDPDAYVYKADEKFPQPIRVVGLNTLTRVENGNTSKIPVITLG